MPRPKSESLSHFDCPRFGRRALAALALALGPVLSGCGTVSYLIQAGRGQLELANRARPIPEVLKDERVPLRIRELLAEIPSIKAYSESIGLRPTKNYQDYVQLDRPAAVWVVSASEKFKFSPKTWSFPIVGSFTYLGWFDRARAIEYGEGLQREGWDVDVRGARAYSTLGWFRDSVLSSMIPSGDEALGELAEVVLHESVHATVYVRGQSYFNESLAEFVAEKVTPGYLSREPVKNARALSAYLEDREIGRRSELAMHQAYTELEALYQSSANDDDKSRKKGEILADLKSKLEWKREINNATLIQFKTYGSGRESFEKLAAACGSDWKRFMSKLSVLKPSDFPEPQAEDFGGVVEKLAGQGCP